MARQSEPAADAAATGYAERAVDTVVVGEARWPTAGAVLAAMVLTILLPDTMRLGPKRVHVTVSPSPTKRGESGERDNSVVARLGGDPSARALTRPGAGGSCCAPSFDAARVGNGTSQHLARLENLRAQTQRVLMALLVARSTRLALDGRSTAVLGLDHRLNLGAARLSFGRSTAREPDLHRRRAVRLLLVVRHALASSAAAERTNDKPCSQGRQREQDKRQDDGDQHSRPPQQGRYGRFLGASTSNPALGNRWGNDSLGPYDPDRPPGERLSRFGSATRYRMSGTGPEPFHPQPVDLAQTLTPFERFASCSS